MLYGLQWGKHSFGHSLKPWVECTAWIQSWFLLRGSWEPLQIEALEPRSAVCRLYLDLRYHKSFWINHFPPPPSICDRGIIMHYLYFISHTEIRPSGSDSWFLRDKVPNMRSYSQMKFVGKPDRHYCRLDAGSVHSERSLKDNNCFKFNSFAKEVHCSSQLQLELLLQQLNQARDLEGRTCRSMSVGECSHWGNGWAW